MIASDTTTRRGPDLMITVDEFIYIWAGVNCFMFGVDTFVLWQHLLAISFCIPSRFCVFRILTKAWMISAFYHYCALVASTKHRHTNSQQGQAPSRLIV